MAASHLQDLPLSTGVVALGESAALLTPPLAADRSSLSLGGGSEAWVAAACKGAGSAAGAGRFAATLSPATPSIGLSACGLWQLPDLVRVAE
jgi:hypothetical protein